MKGGVNLVDIHCHILPAIDDGSKSMEMTMGLCALGADNGITHIIATPHCENLYEIKNFVSARDKRILRVRQELEEDEIPIKLYGGAEVFMSNDIYFSPDLSAVTLAGSRYILIEFDFDDVEFEFIFEAVAFVKNQGFIPIIAHPERYHYFQRDYNFVNRVADLGVLFQVNITDMLKSSGKQSLKLCKAMINANMVSFIATDSHNLYYRNNAVKEMLADIHPAIDTSNFDRLLKENGARVIADRKIDLPKFSYIKKKVFGI